MYLASLLSNRDGAAAKRDGTANNSLLSKGTNPRGVSQYMLAGAVPAWFCNLL